jgi:hypothetical protein
MLSNSGFDIWKMIMLQNIGAVCESGTRGVVSNSGVSQPLKTLSNSDAVIAVTSTISIANGKMRYGRAKAQAVSRQPPTAEALVRSRVSPCGICG